jgi:hypothetical protein
MARGKPKPVIVEDGPEELEPLTLDEERQLQQIDEVLSGLSSQQEAVVRVSRRQADHSLIYYGQMAAEGFSEDALQRKFGGGKFVCNFFHYLGGTLTYHKSITLNVAGPVKDPSRVVVEQAAVETQASVPSGGGDVELRLKLARLEGQLEGMRAQPAQAAPMDPVMMLEKLSTLARNAAPAAPAAPPDPLATVDKILGAVEKIVGVGRDIAPEHPETDWGRVAERGVEAVSLLIEEARGQRGAGSRGVAPSAPGGAPPPAIAPSPGTPALPAEIAAQLAPWQHEVLGWVPRLIGRAAAKKDAVLAADVFVEDISEATVTALVPLAADGGFVEGTLTQLASLVPETVAHRDWFRLFLTAVGENLVEKEGEHGPTGDAGTAGDDAGSVDARPGATAAAG